MSDQRNVTLGGLEFSVARGYETRPTRKYVNSRGEALSGTAQTDKKEAAGPRGSRLKPSR